MVRFQPVTYTVTEGEQAFIMAVLNFVADRDVNVDFTTSDDSATGMVYYQSQIIIKINIDPFDQYSWF